MKKIIATTKAPGAIGPYSQAVEAGGFLFTSGQIAINPATGELEAADIEIQTRRALDNLRAIVEEAGLSMDHVVKTTVFLQHMSDFAKVNAIYAEYFTEGSYPGRSAVEVGALPKGALVEIEAVCVK